MSNTMKARILLARLERVNLQEQTIKAAMEKPKDLTDLNRAQLYRFGQTASKERLKPYKGKKYARVKNQMNPQPGLGTPDFYVTGAFQKAITVTAAGGTLTITSTDRKTPFLLKRDGPQIFGLTDENMQEYRKVLFPRIRRNVNRIVKGK